MDLNEDNCNSDDENDYYLESDDDSTDSGMHANMTLTENSSNAYRSTVSSCLDFYFEAMQNTGQDHIVQLLEEAWKENADLTLKLVFQLRDIRKGKGASIEFHHSLIWLFNHHPLTLIHNLKYLPQHGYW